MRDFNNLAVDVRDLSRFSGTLQVRAAAEFAKIPARSLQRLRSDFFEEIGAYCPAVRAALTASARMQVL